MMTENGVGRGTKGEERDWIGPMFHRVDLNDPECKDLEVELVLRADRICREKKARTCWFTHRFLDGRNAIILYDKDKKLGKPKDEENRISATDRLANACNPDEAPMTEPPDAEPAGSPGS